MSSQEETSQDPSALADGLAQAVAHRRALDEELWPKFKVLKKIFSKVFLHNTRSVSVSNRGDDRDAGKGGSPGSVLKHISDLLYYRGGYPLPSSPPRMDVLARQTGEAVRYLHLLGNLDEFRSKLAEYGVDVVVSNKERFKVNINQGWFTDMEIRNLLLEFDICLEPDATAKDIMKALMDQCLDLQGAICRTSNKVKKDLYDEVSSKNPDLKKPDFLELVKVRVLAEDATVKESSAAKLRRRVQKKVATTQVAYKGLKVAAKSSSTVSKE